MSERFIVDSDFVEYPKLVDTATNCFYHIVDDIRNVEIFCERLNELVEENERLRKETVFLAYWKRKAMTLLMQVRGLTSGMTDKEVKEFSKELEECVSE